MVEEVGSDALLIRLWRNEAWEKEKSSFGKKRPRRKKLGNFIIVLLRRETPVALLDRYLTPRERCRRVRLLFSGKKKENVV